MENPVPRLQGYSKLMAIPDTHILGIRHHGPGSARAVRRALLELKPDVIVMEGPAEAADLLVPEILDGLKPPVAMLFYQSDAFGNAVYFPLAEFSPEWVALKYAREHNIPVKWMDLPASVSMATQGEGGEDEIEFKAERTLDPLGELAKAAGFVDREQWWEIWMETRENTSEIFRSIQMMMEVAREDGKADDPSDLLREAWMRGVIRQAEKDFENPVVICGAWHVPALTGKYKVSDDQALLKGLKKVKISGSWIPWTYRQLSFQSGYGAGVISPAWYEMVYRDRKKAITRWMVKAARLLRSEGMEASSASVIEAIRLSDALAAMRGLSIPGLEEMVESVRTVLFHGYDTPLQLVSDRLIIGNKLGKVPPEAGQSPLEQNVAAEMKRLRMAIKADAESIELDLRKDLHLERSKMLHRLALLGVHWGKTAWVRGKKGTFHEHWTLEWKPAFSLQLIGLQIWGNTLEMAAAKYAVNTAREGDDPEMLGGLLDRVLQADLPEAIDQIMVILEDRAAATHDVEYLITLLPRLVETYRYGNVRGTSSDQIKRVIDSILPRITAGLTSSALGLDEDASRSLLTKIRAGNASVRLLDEPEHQKSWDSSLLQIAEIENVPPLIRGGSTRLLFDGQELETEKVEAWMFQTLSPGTAPLNGALWLEGFLADNVMMLVNHPGLWEMINHWVASMEEDRFVDGLPLLRRTFSRFSMQERSQLRNMVRNPQGFAAGNVVEWDEERAKQVIPAILSFMGIQSV